MGAPDIPSMVPIEFKLVGVESLLKLKYYGAIESAPSSLAVSLWYCEVLTALLSGKLTRLIMKITALASQTCWASRQNAKTKKFKRIEINSPEDMQKLHIDDNFFVAGDELSDELADALLAQVDELGAKLIGRPTENESIHRFWLAPPIASK